MSRHITKIHEGQRNYCKCNYCGKSFSESGNLKIGTSRHYMNDKEITNVFLVENTLRYQEILRSTSRLFMKDKKITNVILAENPSLNQEI